MIIGIIGKKFNGKSEIANYLQSKEELNFIRLSFAEKVKEAANVIYGLDFEQLYGDQKEVTDKRYNLTPRVILQKLGTEVARNIHPLTWVKSLELTYNRLETEDNRTRQVLARQSLNRNYVIDDCRFLNESEWIRSKQGIIVKVIREMPGVIDEHQSEVEMENIHPDYVIYNNKNIPHLYYEINKILYKERECLERRCEHSEHSTTR